MQHSKPELQSEAEANRMEISAASRRAPADQRSCGRVGDSPANCHETLLFWI